MRYLLKTINDLFFAVIDDKKYLIDTASPFTFSKNGYVIINQKKYKNDKMVKVFKDRVNKLSKYLNVEVNGIIGLNVIKEFGLTINKKYKYVSFTSRNKMGKVFDVSIKNNEEYEYVVLNGDAYGFNPYGNFDFVLDLGISDSIFDLELGIHSQYAYRKDVYYLALNENYSIDFVFDEIKQNDNVLKLEVGTNKDNKLLRQLEFINAKGLISLNRVIEKTLVIDLKKNIIIID